MTATHTTSDTKDRELSFERVLDAPRELVFQAFTRPEHVAQWWGPNGFTTTTHEMDVRPGGVWRMVMHGPDGTDYDNLITYLEVVEPERLVYDHGDQGDPQQFHVSVTFEELAGGKTRLTMRSLFQSKAALEYVVKEYGAIEGAKQTLNRLTEFLRTMS